MSEANRVASDGYRLSDRVGTLIHGFSDPDHRSSVRQLYKDVRAMEDALREFVSLTEDMSNGKDVGNRLIVAWNVADGMLSDNAKHEGQA